MAILNFDNITFGIVFIASIIILMPNPLDPVLWKTPFTLPSLEGKWSPNYLLNGTIMLNEGLITAPESIAIDKKSGRVYASLNDGRVVSVSKDGATFNNILFVGGIISSPNSNDGLSESKLLEWCQSEVKGKRLAWNVTGEMTCGRPLGLRLKEEKGKDVLYILDAYHGLFTYDISSKIIIHVFSQNAPISIPKGTTEDTAAVLSSPVRFFNDLDISNTGIIYFSDSSYKHYRSQNRQEILDGAPRGRLLAFNTADKTMKVLLCGLHFPNGVQLLPDQKSLLLVESCRFRILKINLQKIDPMITSTTTSTSSEGENHLLSQCGEISYLSNILSSLKVSQEEAGVTVFVDQIPGFLDNIRLDTISNNKILGGIGTKSAKPFSLLWIGYQSTLLRNLIGRLVPMKYVEKLLPKYGLVAVFDLEGNLLSSLHDPSGRIHLISEVDRHPLTGDLWIGSHANPYLGLLPATEFDI